jgi:hypothetical protein
MAFTSTKQEDRCGNLGKPYGIYPLLNARCATPINPVTTSTEEMDEQLKMGRKGRLHTEEGLRRLSFKVVSNNQK